MNILDKITADLKSSTHLMVDIETWGTELDAVIVELSVVSFNDQNGVLQAYEFLPDIFEQLKAGRSFDADTINWWKEQRTEENRHIHDPFVNRQTANVMHLMLTSLVADVDGYIWCRGVGFDLPIINHYFKSLNLSSPLHAGGKFRQHMEHRIFVPSMTRITRENNHHALDDCMNQIESLREVWK